MICTNDGFHMVHLNELLVLTYWLAIHCVTYKNPVVPKSKNFSIDIKFCDNVIVEHLERF
jgi:hypothetical protein